MYEYYKVKKALIYIAENYKEQPSLEQLSNIVGMNQYDFQKTFTHWAGISPKQFLQYINFNYAKEILLRSGSVTDASYDVGLSSTSRLHELFITLTAMTPAEYKNMGKNLEIEYSFNNSKFGNYLVASTKKGICELMFGENNDTLSELNKKWANATKIEKFNDQHKLVANFINNKLHKGEKIKLHLKGTNFQTKVWEALLKIPETQLTTYSKIASNINSRAFRAVGTAIGSNPVAFIIPCHRVIKSTGDFGNYRWGKDIKIAMIGLEQIK